MADGRHLRCYTGDIRPVIVKTRSSKGPLIPSKLNTPEGVPQMKRSPSLRFVFPVLAILALVGAACAPAPAAAPTTVPAAPPTAPAAAPTQPAANPTTSTAAAQPTAVAQMPTTAPATAAAHNEFLSSLSQLTRAGANSLPWWSHARDPTVTSGPARACWACLHCRPRGAEPASEL